MGSPENGVLPELMPVRPAVLAGSSLPLELPDQYPDQPLLPGVEDAAAELAAGRALEWREG